MSIPIIASSAKLESEITGAVAAVTLVVSEASIVIFVESIVVPASLMSTVNVLPTGAVLTEALTEVNVNAYGILNLTLLVPVVNAVVSSEAAITKDCTKSLAWTTSSALSIYADKNLVEPPPIFIYVPCIA